ncbi:MAG: ribokinase [Cypionkella sp.]|nr:ribokinase [Cypionkella sp.]
MGKPVVVLGIFNADTGYRAARLPKLGETIMGAGFHLGPGGKGSNQATAAARAGGDVHMVTRLGEDDFAAMARAVWADAGVKPHVIVDRESHTGSAFIFLQEGTGQNAIIVCPGAAGRISEDDVEAHRALIEGAGVFLTQLEQPQPAALAALKIARAAGVTTILNPAPAAALPDEMLALVDILTPNESEAETLTGLPVTTVAEAEAAADALIARGVGAVIVTLGANGVLWRKDGVSLHAPARAPGPVVDTTGAGDAFNGGFAVALSEGQAIADALAFGCAVAGISVTRHGAATAMPARAEVEALLAS